MTEEKVILFYDIASGPPIRSYAPNPSKSRYALNFKKVNYKTKWVELPDVTATRKDVLKVPPARRHLNGSEYYTMPVIHDLATGEKIGDSFDIALYLDKTYPSSGDRLFPQDSEASMREWNAKCDAVFSGTNNTFGSIGLLYAHGLPFNPATAEQSKAEFVARIPDAKSWDDFDLTGESRNKALEGFKGDMKDLASHFRKKEEGPYLEGDLATYADIILGGWLKFLSVCLPEWEQVKAWDDGIWDRLHQSLQKDYGEDK